MSHESPPHAASETSEELFEEILEQDKRLSECMLWQLQEDFYAHAGPEAWQSVPYLLTCNAYIGRTYAEMIVAFLLDYQDQLRPDEPVYLIELAAGSGMLAFNIVKELTERLSYFEKLKNLSWVYVITDFTEHSLVTCENHTKLRPYIEKGVVETAVFRPEDQNILTLRQSQRVLSPQTVKNPVLGIANYFFDSIRQDLFRVENGVLQEGRVSFSRKRLASENNKPVELADIIKTEHFVDMDENYYDDPRLNRVLHRYRDRLKNGSIIFPLGAFRSLNNLLDLSGNQLVLISSDKGYVHAGQLRGHRDHNYARHGGAFSFMVNFHAIQWFFEDLDGAFLKTPDESLVLDTVIGIRVDGSANSFSHSRYYFEETMNRQNPINHLFHTQDLIDGLKALEPKAVFTGGLSFLRLCNYEPLVFYYLGEPLLNMVTDLDEFQQTQLIEAMEQVYENYFFVRKKFCVFFWIGSLYFLMERYFQSMEVFKESIRLLGPDENSLYYIGACQEMLGYPAEALHYYQQALELNPNCEMTQNGIHRLTGHP